MPLNSIKQSLSNKEEEIELFLKGSNITIGDLALYIANKTQDHSKKINKEEEKHKEEMNILLNDAENEKNNNLELLQNKLRNTSEEIIQPIEIERFFNDIINKLNHICMNCDLTRNESNYSQKDRMSYLDDKINQLITLYDREDNNFLRKVKVAESIGFDENVRKTFMGGMNHLVKIYNDESLSEDRKFKQIYTTSLFLTGLLNRNFNE